MTSGEDPQRVEDIYGGGKIPSIKTLKDVSDGPGIEEIRMTCCFWLPSCCVFSRMHVNALPIEMFIYTSALNRCTLWLTF